ncbi:hypothetical protein OZG88_21960 [Escherichia coli]|uniref:hypothetical protein n=1 Tax=Escherichia coli TaxID=562 RepID=UPI00227E9839|nr:hypothetical protein [Escherichia coli]MCZ0305509.1 hypothetical protein [Escherichia coli]MCZ0309890.1 hypothetical protein [Escherichia coli]MCZ0338670.1 hypothetical protein [Escherichia coli]MCZ0404848.1 hypothetical protein [Escherichia coli]MCZ0478554.1 hypothetical protein [Escherichia coli]
MAGLTKEQRAQREAAQKTQIELVVMVTDYQMFPGAPTIANVILPSNSGHAAK